jgi:DNA-binding NarL/FixJ family response regulator
MIETAAQIRVLIAEDHQVVRAGLERLLEGWPSIDVVASAANGRDAVAMVAIHHPDVVLMDLSMPIMGGLEATRLITDQSPTTRVVVLTSFDDSPTISQALDAGATGYLLKDSDPAALRSGIEAAAIGEAPLHPRVAQSVLAARRDAGRGPSLTAREWEILDLVRGGLANKEIAHRLGITVKTVKAHLTNLFDKIGVLDRTQAAIWAERHAPDRSGLQLA